MKTRDAVLPKSKVCSCGYKHDAGIKIKEKLTEDGKSFDGQFWFDCAAGCGSTMVVMTEGK